MNKLLLRIVVFFALYMMCSYQIFGQDYITVKDGDNLTVTILRVDSAKLVFKQFESTDTTQYFLLKENIVSIVFASTILKKVKNFSFKNEPKYKSINTTISPDYIYPIGGEFIKVIIQNISDDQIQFHIAFSNDTNTYFLKKTEIEEITFNQISFQESENEYSEEELIAKGRADAYQNYDGYKPAAVGSFIAGACIWFYFVPVLVPVIVSSVPPQEENLGMTNPKLMKKVVYSNSYSKTAKSIKTNKAWSNFGYGAVTSVGLGVALIFYALTIVR